MSLTSIYGAPSPLPPAWDGGAVSNAVLTGSGWFRFRVPDTVHGVVVGLNSENLGNGYVEIDHAFQFAKGTFRVLENGVARTGYAGHGISDVFRILRYDERVFYLRDTGGDQSTAQGVPFALPGQLVHESTTPSLSTVFLDASLYAADDSILDAGMVDSSGAYGGTDTEPFGFPQGVTGELRLAGGAGDVARAIAAGSIEFTLTAYEIPRVRVTVAFRPWTGGAGMLGRGAAQGEMRLSGQADGGFDGGSYQFGYGYIPPFIGAARGRVALRVTPAMGLVGLAGANGAAGAYGEARGAFALTGAATGSPVVHSALDASMPHLHTGGEVDLESVGFAQTATFPGWSANVHDHADADEEGLPSSASAQLLIEPAVASERVQFNQHELALSEGVASEEVIAQHALTRVTDEATASEEAASSARRFVLHTDSAQATDQALSASAESITDEATAEDALFAGGAALVESSAAAGELVFERGQQPASLLVSSAQASEEASTQIHATGLVVESATASEDALYKKPGAIAWVMNTETSAASWYSNWQFVDMAQVGDTVYAVGPSGLAVLGAATDAGDSIDAGVSYGFTDFGTEQKKRVDGFYLGYTSDGLLEATVETYGNPPYTYAMDPRSADAPRENRIRPGRGLNARYWRIAFDNVDGADFTITSVSADILPGARRV